MKRDNMCAQASKDEAEHGIALLSVSVTGLQSHSRYRLLLKVLLRSLFSLILALCLVFFVVHHYQNEEHNLQNHLNQHPHQEDQFGKDHGNGLHAFNRYGDSEDKKNHLTNVHRKGGDIAYAHQNVKHFVDHLGKSIDFHSSNDHIIKQHRNVNGVVGLGKVEVLGSQMHISTSNSAVSHRLSKKARSKLHASSRAKMNSFVKILQDLLLERLLKLHLKILCLDAHADKEVVALKKRGFGNVEGVNILPALLNLKHTQKSILKENLVDQSYDFVFTTMFDHIYYPALFVAEIERTLKLGGFAAMHVSLNAWRNKYISGERGHGIKPVTVLFKHSEIVYVSTAYAPGLDTIIVFKKVTHVKPRGSEMKKKQLHADALVSQPMVDPVEPSCQCKCRNWAEEQQWKGSRYVPKLWDIGSLLHTKVNGMFQLSATRSTHDEIVVQKSVPINLEALLVKGSDFVAWLNKAMVRDSFSATKMRIEAHFNDGVAGVNS